MAVALKLQPEFDIGFMAGDLSHMFGDKSGKAVNATVMLHLVHNSDTPRENELGHALDTQERLRRYHIGDRAAENEHKLTLTTWNYNDREIRKEPSGFNGPGNDDADFSTEIGRLKTTASSQGYTQSEEMRRQREFMIWLLIDGIKQDGEYLQELMRQLAEVEAKLETLNVEREALRDTQELLKEDDMRDLDKPVNRNRLARSLRKHGLDIDNFTDRNGNIDRAKLEAALREQERMQAEREVALLAQRDELRQQYAEAQTKRDVYHAKAAEPLMTLGLNASTAKAIAEDKTDATVMATMFKAQLPQPAAISTITIAANDPEMADLDQLLAEDNKPAPETALAQLPQPQISEPAALLIADSKARTGSAAAIYGDVAEESSVITSLFKKASDPALQTIESSFDQEFVPQYPKSAAVYAMR